MDENKKGLIKVIAIFAGCISIMIAILVIYSLRDRMSEQVHYVIGIIAFGIMGIVGLFDFVRSIIMSNSRKSKDAVIVRGIIVKHIIHNDNDADGRSWIPVYEYYADGEIRRIKGKVAGGRMGKRAVGAEVKIVHNNVTGEAFCIADARDIRWIGFVFMILGFAIVAVLVLKLIGRF